MSRRRDATNELIRATGVHFVHFAGRMIVERADSRPWASITFSGARHRLSLLLEGSDARDAAGAFLDGLGEREFALRGHVVADIAGDLSEAGKDRVRLNVEALTLEAD